MSAAAPILATHALSVGYRLSRTATRTVLSDITVALRAGEFACLLGPNGVGKSTLLRTLCGVQRPLAGAVTVRGTDLRKLNQGELARCLSVVLTERVEVGMMLAYDLVGLGRYPHTGWAGRLTPNDHAVIRWAIAATGAGPLASRLTSELSDGERQRVMIARALAQEPAVMLLDEPTAFLDLPRRAELTALLRRLARETGLAVLLSTHELELALRAADTIWLVSTDGRFVTGSPEDLVLDGTFEKAFRGDEIAFDPYLGGFRLRPDRTGRASLRSSGLASVWTRRVLERAGYEVLNGAEPLVGQIDLHVECIEHDGGRYWRSNGNGAVREHPTLADLASFVQAYAEQIAAAEVTGEEQRGT
jgi:iron complex transport system ATP-binding protein